MKNLIFKILLIACGVVGISYSGSAQSNVCTYTTCVPGLPFRNSDLMQIYAAVLQGGGGVSSGTISAGGLTAKYTGTMETSAPAYSSGDCVGGILTFSNVLREDHTTAVLQDVVVWDNIGQNAALVIDFWADSPSGTFTDNSPTSISDPDDYLGSVLVSAADYVTTAGSAKSRATITGIGLTLKSAAGSASPQSIYFTITTTGTPTYGAGTTNLYVKGGFLLD